MTCGISPAEAAKATAKILDYYSTIPAMDPQQFAAGLTKILSTFPSAVVARATDPVDGIPARVKFLNLAEICEFLDIWRAEYLVHQERLSFGQRKALPFPEDSPEARKRVIEGFRKLSDHLAVRKSR
jgi:hypothetical protein